MSKDMAGKGPAVAAAVSGGLADESHSGKALLSRWRADGDERRTLPSAKTGDGIRARQQNPLLVVRPVGPGNVFRDQLLHLSVNHHYPAALMDRSRAVVRQRSWLLHVLELPWLSPTLEQAMLAVGTVRLGRRDAKDALEREGLVRYTRALGGLRRAVAGPGVAPAAGGPGRHFSWSCPRSPGGGTASTRRRRGPARGSPGRSP